MSWWETRSDRVEGRYLERREGGAEVDRLERRNVLRAEENGGRGWWHNIQKKTSRASSLPPALAPYAVARRSVVEDRRVYQNQPGAGRRRWTVLTSLPTADFAAGSPSV